jgi:hypothetical protein
MKNLMIAVHNEMKAAAARLHLISRRNLKLKELAEMKVDEGFK